MENYEEWVATVPEEIKADSLWTVAAYRLALFLSDLGWHDTARLVQNRQLIGLPDQFYRALGSVSANIAEGYSRGTGQDRARFYEYALGFALESWDWYYKARHALGEDVFQHCLQLLTRAIQLLLTMIPNNAAACSVNNRPPARLPLNLPKQQTHCCNVSPSLTTPDV